MAMAFAMGASEACDRLPGAQRVGGGFANTAGRIESVFIPVLSLTVVWARKNEHNYAQFRLPKYRGRSKSFRTFWLETAKAGGGLISRA